MASRISSRQRRRVSFVGSGRYSRCGYRGSEDKIFSFGRWRRLASNFYGAVIADFSKIGLVEHKMCLIKASVPVAIHFLVCVMNGTSFFNRMLPRTRIALFGANVSFELDWAFRKLACLLGLRTGRFRGRLSCCVRPWPSVMACFLGWGSDLSASCMSFCVGLRLFRKSCPQIRKNGRDLRL